MPELRSTGVTPAQVDAALLGDAPTGTIAVSVPRAGRMDASTITSGTLYLTRCFTVVRAGRAVNTITFVSGDVAASVPLNQWACLVDNATDRNVLAKTADRTSDAWGADVAQTFTLASAWIPTADIRPYIGLVVVAATPPNIMGAANARSSVVKIAPKLTVTANTALTDPASLGATTAAFVDATAQPFAYLA